MTLLGNTGPLNLKFEKSAGASGSIKAIFADLDKVQGNILKGHGRDHAAHLFLQFAAAKQVGVRAWIKQVLLPMITDATSQLTDAAEHRKSGKDSGLFCVAMVSAKGLSYFGKHAAFTPAVASQLFLDGMKAPKSVATIDDPVVTNWQADYQKDWHMMVILASIHPAITRYAAESMQLKLSALGLITDAYPEFGDQRKNDVGEGIEHFGYVDGRSQPIFIAADAARENDGVSIWDPSASVDLVLVDDPLSPGAHGSYFVFRKLEENVKQFKLAEQELANTLGLVGDAREVAGAMVIGRFEDGTPVELSDKPLIEDLAATPKIKHGSVPNNFDYEADPDGNRCPIHAHIRKTNPRGSLGSAFKTAVLPGGDPVAFSKAVQMARRGMTYGERKDDGSVIDNMPEAGVGLLFMSYQANITNQFRVMQKLWANSDVFPDHVPGPPAPPIANLIDPVIGQPPGAHSPNAKWPVTWNDPAAGRQPFSFKLFVTMKGGEYFYAPSLPGLAAL